MHRCIWLKMLPVDNERLRTCSSEQARKKALVSAWKPNTLGEWESLHKWQKLAIAMFAHHSMLLHIHSTYYDYEH